MTTKTGVIFGIVLAATWTASVPSSAQSPQKPPVLLQMIRDDAIHDDLDLSKKQRDAILAALPDIDGRWFRARQFPADKQLAEIESLSKQLLQQMAGILDANQMERLGQLRRQALGTRMVLLDDVVQTLRLTKDQTDAFRESFINTDTKSIDLQKQVREGSKNGTEAQKEIERLKNDERKNLVGQLTTDQRNKLGALSGSPFNFASVKRMYPLAPELTSKGVTWIQGGPLTLKQLRGKVVAVHYYAFQCINCKRNLPHYKAWHDDYKDKDLVIIGIQSPETQAERSANRVSEAAKSNGIEYPVILDAEKSNWTKWNNTMWPTVYLIDKKGFIRRWWQGEMNWKGTPGEQQMRQTIEMLLEEDS